jgi:hypothetical protein
MSSLKELQDHLLTCLARFKLLEEEDDSDLEPLVPLPRQFQQALYSQPQPRTPSQRASKRTRVHTYQYLEYLNVLNTRKRRRLSGDTRADPSILGGDSIREIRLCLKGHMRSCKKYRELFDEMPVYWASIALNPGLRLKGLWKQNPAKADVVEQNLKAY